MKDIPTNAGKQRRLRVRFIPQQWLADMAIPCAMPESVDATDHLLTLSLQEIHALTDCSEGSDGFVDPLDRAHFGPYEVHCVDAVLAYFGVSRLADITQEMLDSARRGEYLQEDRTHLLRPWLVICGQDRLSFFCQAEDIEHASEQCRDAYPDLEVISAMRVPVASDDIGPQERRALLDDISAALGIPVVAVNDEFADCEQSG